MMLLRLGCYYFVYTLHFLFSVGFILMINDQQLSNKRTLPSFEYVIKSSLKLESRNDFVDIHVQSH